MDSDAYLIAWRLGSLVTSLTDALVTLDEAVGQYLSGTAPQERVSASVAKVNSEIGKEYKRSSDPRLKDLQRKVNEVTISSKSGDIRRVKEAMESVRRDAFLQW